MDYKFELRLEIPSKGWVGAKTFVITTDNPKDIWDILAQPPKAVDLAKKAQALANDYCWTTANDYISGPLPNGTANYNRFKKEWDK